MPPIPAGENFRPVRQYGCAYAFYRRNAPANAGHELHFDADGRLYVCVALPRLVHPTAADYYYAARIREWQNGARQIVPPRMPYLNEHAFVVDPNENWLIPADMPLLRDLLTAYHRSQFPSRLTSALWYYEAVARNYYVDLRWPLLTTALEALIRISHERLPSGRYVGSTKVFVDRLLAIGTIDASLAVPETDLEHMYEQRSLLTHGMPFGNLDDARKTLYRQQDRLARGVLRKALLDLSFRAVFASDATVSAGLPLRQ